jgi:hypothetical protein
MQAQIVTTPPLSLFREWIFCPVCRAYLRADFVIYWRIDPDTPRCANCESIVQ